MDNVVAFDDEVELYGNIGYVANPESICKTIWSAAKDLEAPTLFDVRDYLNNAYDESRDRMYTADYKETKNILDAEYLWIDTTLRNHAGEKLFVQFHQGAAAWEGAYAGTAKKIVMNQISKFKVSPRKKKDMLTNLGILTAKYRQAERDLLQQDDGNTEENIPACEQSAAIEPTAEESSLLEFPSKTDKATRISEQYRAVETGLQENIYDDEYEDDECSHEFTPEETRFYQNIYDRMLIKAGWDIEKIRGYLFTLICRLNAIQKKGKKYKEIYYVTSLDKKYAMINTALINSLGNPIKLIIAYNKERQFSKYYTQWIICDSKATALNLGFDKDEIKTELARVPFYNNNPSELIFSGDIEDFDLENERHLLHCIERRVERFKDNIGQLTETQLYADIVSAVQFGVSISRYDTSYVKAHYSRKHDYIQFMIPYHVNRNFSEPPALAIIVSKSDNGLWQIMTILDAKDAKDDCRLLSLYSGNTL